MKLSSYSSLAAFVVHYRALRSSPKPTGDERVRLAETEALLDSIGADARAAIDSDLGAHDSGEARRHERAERRLRRELLARGVLTG